LALHHDLLVVGETLAVAFAVGEDRWDEAAGPRSNVVAEEPTIKRAVREKEASHGAYRHRRAQGEEPDLRRGGNRGDHRGAEDPHVSGAIRGGAWEATEGAGADRALCGALASVSTSVDKKAFLKSCRGSASIVSATSVGGNERAADRAARRREQERVAQELPAPKI
jgi:hypothetical protein